MITKEEILVLAFAGFWVIAGVVTLIDVLYKDYREWRRKKK